MPGPKPRPLLARIMERVTIDPVSGCWLYGGTLNDGGYAIIATSHSAQVLVHRAAYELLVGPIPDGLDLDHQCHNRDLTCVGGPTCQHRRCINPEHCEPAKRKLNLQRGRQPDRTRAQSNAKAALKGRTHCIHGHEFTPENTITRKHDHRNCRKCKSDEQKRRYARKKAER
jgi:HNH endonuclease